MSFQTDEKVEKEIPNIEEYYVIPHFIIFRYDYNIFIHKKKQANKLFCYQKWNISLPFVYIDQPNNSATITKKNCDFLLFQIW